MLLPLQVSFGSTSPALSDRNEFPLFYRTVAPDSSHNPARIAFIRRFGWDTVTTFSQNEEIHSLAVNDLVTELENANISCAATITFGETDFKNQLKMLRVNTPNTRKGSLFLSVHACGLFMFGLCGAHSKTLSGAVCIVCLRRLSVGFLPSVSRMLRYFSRKGSAFIVNSH